MALTAAFVKGVCHAGGRKRADRHHDQHGLYLQARDAKARHGAGSQRRPRGAVAVRESGAPAGQLRLRLLCLHRTDDPARPQCVSRTAPIASLSPPRHSLSRGLARELSRPPLSPPPCPSRTPPLWPSRARASALPSSPAFLPLTGGSSPVPRHARYRQRPVPALAGGPPPPANSSRSSNRKTCSSPYAQSPCLCLQSRTGLAGVGVHGAR